MNDMQYIEFLDWLRRRDVVTLKLEDGTMLATGFRPRSPFETYNVREILNGISIRRELHMTSLGLIRRRHGDGAVDTYAAARGWVGGREAVSKRRVPRISSSLQVLINTGVEAMRTTRSRPGG